MGGPERDPDPPNHPRSRRLYNFGPSAPPGALWRRVPGARAGLHHGDEERNHQEDPVFWLQKRKEGGDSLGWVLSGQEGDSVIVGTASGKVLRFEVSAGGVKAIKLAADDSVVGMAVIPKSMTKDNSGS